MNHKWLLPALLLPLTIKSVAAHCPLCTAGVAVAAGGAAYLGVSDQVIGLFVGAFAVSTGWWVSRLVKRRFIPFQRGIIIFLSFLLTVIPLLSLFKGIYPLYISWLGEYGSVLNRTYMLNSFLAGSVLGSGIVCFTPWLSRKISALRMGKMIPFQGVLLTLMLLVAIGGILQLVM